MQNSINTDKENRMMNMFGSKAKLVVIVIASVLTAIGSLCLSEAYAQVKASAAAAAANPTWAPAVVGWRGDGTGRYPDATPPTEWFLKESGESENILWKVKLPCYSWATPIIVGDKVFTRSEPYDLICLDKNTGKLLWIRSHPPIVAVTAEERKANPAFKEIDTLVADLGKLNDEFVANGWSKEVYTKKHELQVKINGLSAKADEKYALPPDQYVESWSGYTGATPCSDGKFIYISSGDGITACYDLDGNLKWSRYAQITKNGWGEHGYASSPTIVGDKLLLVTTKLVAFNKTTGEELWSLPIGAGYGILSFKAGGTDFIFAVGNYIRVSDGKIAVPRGVNWPS
jgi:outer membrane protein assembly factor BamB